MPQEEVSIGSVGPFLFDEPDFYGLHTTGQLKVEMAPTEDTHVLRKEDLDTLILSGVDPLSVETIAAPGTALVASRDDHVHPGVNLDDIQDISGIKNFVNGLKIGGNEPILTYNEESFTITGTGFTASITGTAKYILLGKLVFLFIPTLVGTSNTTAFTLTGLPSAIVPTNSQRAVVFIIDNTVAAVGLLDCTAASNVLIVHPSPVSTVWTAGGTKALTGCCIVYLLT